MCGSISAWTSSLHSWRAAIRAPSRTVPRIGQVAPDGGLRLKTADTLPDVDELPRDAGDGPDEILVAHAVMVVANEAEFRGDAYVGIR